jgi:hypothetical protein
MYTCILSVYILVYVYIQTHQTQDGWNYRQKEVMVQRSPRLAELLATNYNFRKARKHGRGKLLGCESGCLHNEY